MNIPRGIEHHDIKLAKRAEIKCVQVAVNPLCVRDTRPTHPRVQPSCCEALSRGIIGYMAASVKTAFVRFLIDFKMEKLSVAAHLARIALVARA